MVTHTGIANKTLLIHSWQISIIRLFITFPTVFLFLYGFDVVSFIKPPTLRPPPASFEKLVNFINLQVASQSFLFLFSTLVQLIGYCNLFTDPPSFYQFFNFFILHFVIS